jgi:hypothetical protein
MKFIKITAIAVSSLLILSACSEGRNATVSKEKKAATTQLDQYLQSQPVPLFNTSQLRQNLIDIQTAQVNSTVTTSFFFNQGVVDPVHSCPSIGFPIPGTFQLTNPQQKLRDSEAVIAQLEANGVYTGDTTGTTAICIDDAGKGYAMYWEGFINTVAGPAKWDETTKRVVLTGAPTAEFNTGQE